MPTGYQFDSQSTRRIAAAVRKVEKMRTDLRGPRARRRDVFAGGAKLIPMRLTGSSVLKSVSSTVGGGSSVSVEIMWTYSAVEIESFNPTTQTMTDKSGGLSLSATGAGGLSKLYNQAEWSHSASYAWGIKYDDTNYPTGNRPRPVGGGGTSNTHKYNRPVWVQTFKDQSGNTIYVMNEMGSHDGSCT